MSKSLALFSVVVVFAGIASAEPIIRYVSQGGSGTKDGTSWENASADVKTAYEAVGANADGGEVWIAAGLHGKKQNDNSWWIALKSNVTVRGGFAGGETSADQADPVANETVLTPDIRDVTDKDANAPYDEWCPDLRAGAGSGYKVRTGNVINPPPEAQRPEVRGWFGTGKDGYRCLAFGLGSGRIVNSKFTGITFVSYMTGGVKLLATATSQDDVSDMTFEDCRFVACGSSGGNAINTKNVNLTVRRCSFIGCLSAIKVDATAGVKATAELSDSKFTWCGTSGYYVGPACFYAVGDTVPILCGNVFEKSAFVNIKDNRGAACVNIADDSQEPLLISNCTFECSYACNTQYVNNISCAVLNIGRAGGSLVDLVNCHFDGNTNITFHSGNLYGISACINYGPKSNASTAPLFVRGCSFRDNCLSNAVANASTTSSILSEVTSSCKVLFINCTVERNVATSASADTTLPQGRTMACFYAADQVLVNCIFNDNDCFVGGARVPELFNKDPTRGFYNTIMWHTAEDYQPFDSNYLNVFNIANCDFWRAPDFSKVAMHWAGFVYNMTTNVNPLIDAKHALEKDCVAEHLRITRASPFRKTGCKVYLARDGWYYYYDAGKAVDKRWRPIHDKLATALTDEQAAEIGLTLAAAPIPDAFGAPHASPDRIAYGPLDPLPMGLIILLR